MFQQNLYMLLPIASNQSLPFGACQYDRLHGKRQGGGKKREEWYNSFDSWTIIYDLVISYLLSKIIIFKSFLTRFSLALK